MCHSGYYHCYYNLVVITVIIIWRDRKLGLPIKIWLAVHLYRESNPSLQCRNLAFDQNRDSTYRGCKPQVAEKDSKRLMDRCGSQQKHSGANWPGEDGAVSPETSVEMAGARAEDDRVMSE